MSLVNKGGMVICFAAAQNPAKSANSGHNHHKAKLDIRLLFCVVALQHLPRHGLKPRGKATQSMWHDETSERSLNPMDCGPLSASSQTQGTFNCGSLIPVEFQLVYGMPLNTALEAQISSTALSSCCARHHPMAQQLVTPTSTAQLHQPSATSALLVCAA